MAKASTKNRFCSRHPQHLLFLLLAMILIISLLALIVNPVASSTTHQHKKAKGSNYASGAYIANSGSSDTGLHQQDEEGFELAAEGSDIETPPAAECSIEVRQVVKYAGKCVRFKGGLVAGCESFVGGYVEPFNHECMSSNSGK